jgi:hypothetical protein
MADVEKKSFIRSVSDLLRSASYFIWGLVALIVIAGLGYKFVASDKTPQQGQIRPPRTQAIVTPNLTDALDKEVAKALEDARNNAREYAAGELDAWEKQLKQRTENDFLPWYFSYWNTQVRGIQALYHGALHWADSDSPTAEERLTEEIQKQFTIRVLQPATSQLILERVQRETVERYLGALKNRLAEIPKQFDVSQPVWDQYISDLSKQTAVVEGGRQVPVTLKVIYTTAAGGGVLLAKQIITVFGKGLGGIGTQVAGKMLGKSGSALLAAKTGGKVAGKFGGEFLGPIVGVGIIVWDVYDHASTVDENKPILRDSIYKYLDEMKLVLLDDPKTGIMAPIYQMDRHFAESLQTAAEQRRK